MSAVLICKWTLSHGDDDDDNDDDEDDDVRLSDSIKLFNQEMAAF